jgi:hypothetical protein
MGKQYRWGTAAGALFIALGATGCSSEEATPDATKPTPTYSEDVAPLLDAHCTTCHQEGGIAPVAFTDYASVKKYAGEIAEKTTARAMPPMPVNNDGSCNTYSNARWLTAQEIETFAAWAEAGAPAGDADVERHPPEPPPALEDPDAIVDIGTDYTPDSSLGQDDYRCFVVDAPTDRLEFVTEYQVIPGDSRVVHHVIAYQPSSEEAVANAEALDASSDGPGYTCFGSSGVDAEPLALWAPGAGSIAMPKNTGVRLAAGRKLIVQIHYNLENGVFPDRTRLALRFAKEPVITGQYWAAVNQDFVAPPGRELFESSATNGFPQPTSFRVHGAIPHMHTLGSTMHVTAEGKTSQCLVDVDRWDFHWQNAWWYQKPLDLKDVSALNITCGFDTRSRSESVAWGDSTTDEMCISYFYVTTSDMPDPVVSCDDADNPLFGSCFEDFLAGCYEPDLGGMCSVTDGTTLEWSDGSKIMLAGDAVGLYGPGDEEPCIGIAGDQKGVTLTRGDDTLGYSEVGDHLAFVCPDGSTLNATPFHLSEYGICRGLACPQ